MANTTFKSEVKWTGTGLQADAQAGAHVLRTDEPEELGGTNTGQNPVEMVLSALGGCMVVLVNAFAPAHKVEVKDVRVEVEGDLDPDGFLGQAPVRAGFSAVRYKLHVESDSDPAAVEALIEHVESSCPVKDTLSGVPVERA